MGLSNIFLLEFPKSCSSQVHRLPTHVAPRLRPSPQFAAFSKSYGPPQKLQLSLKTTGLPHIQSITLPLQSTPEACDNSSPHFPRRGNHITASVAIFTCGSLIVTIKRSIGGRIASKSYHMEVKLELRVRTWTFATKRRASRKKKSVRS